MGRTFDGIHRISFLIVEQEKLNKFLINLKLRIIIKLSWII